MVRFSEARQKSCSGASLQSGCLALTRNILRDERGARAVNYINATTKRSLLINFDYIRILLQLLRSDRDNSTTS